MILFVDDDIQLRKLAERALGRAGYEVTVARTAGEAIAVLDDKPVELLVTDLALPGMSGGELMEQVRRRCPDLPVLVVSGFRPEKLKLPEGVRLLSKPFTGEDLVSEVRETLTK